ncbi:MAG: proline dehydrogenase family protein [Bacteroidota bacterium]
MNEKGGPVPEAIGKLQGQLQEAGLGLPELDFDDTEKAFARMSDRELKSTVRLFKLMANPNLTNTLSGLGLKAVEWGLPGANWAVENTLYRQFVGGKSLVSCIPTIQKFHEYGVLSLLDYGAEGKESEEDYNTSQSQLLSAIEFAAQQPAVPVVTCKITSLARNGLLEELQAAEFVFSDELKREYDGAIRRLDAICNVAEQRGVKVFIDAEESWFQETIDRMATLMMERYNRDRVTVYNTFQLYRHDRLAYLMASQEEAASKGYLLGAKLVRGAYMEKERARALEMGYPSPIQPNLAATHDDFNAALRFCLDHYETLASCNASHNRASVKLQAGLIAARNLPRKHEHLNFCQLLGMSDNLTFNLAAAGYNVAKYMVYGPVRDVMPYLVRRAQENKSITGDTSRELKMLQTELKRRRSR